MEISFKEVEKYCDFHGSEYERTGEGAEIY